MFATWANKKVQYGYPGKNGQVSDQTERNVKSTLNG